jgi:hypothetical protein
MHHKVMTLKTLDDALNVKKANQLLFSLRLHAIHLLLGFLHLL